MKLAVAAAAAGLSVLGMSAAGALGSPPPGATAQCRDGTYSYSHHHSGTCSHHGGVAVWLDGTGTTPASPAVVPAGAATTSTALPSIGHTVLLASRTKTSGCTLGPLPDRRCSPGAYYSGLTKAVICSSTFRTGSIRNVPDSEKHQVELEYGLAAKSYGSTLEIDHLISLQLGGSNDIANLFPEKAAFAGHQPGFHIKGTLENKLHQLVCSGQMTLRSVQQQIAANWETLYKKVYGVAPTG